MYHVSLSSYRNMSGSLGEQEMLWEHQCNGVPVCHRNICKVMRGM